MTDTYTPTSAMPTTSQPVFSDPILPPLDYGLSSTPFSFSEAELQAHAHASGGDGGTQPQPQPAPWPSTSTAPYQPVTAAVSASTIASPYHAWQPFRETLRDIESRTSSYYPARRPSASGLERALEGLDSDAGRHRSSPSPERRPLPQQVLNDTTSTAAGRTPPPPSRLSATSAAAAFSTNASPFVSPQTRNIASTTGPGPVAANDITSLLDRLGQLPPGAPQQQIPQQQSRSTMYSAYPGQWDFIAHPDSYAEHRAPYTPSYDSLSLAGQDDSDSLFDTSRESAHWGPPSEIGSEDAFPPYIASPGLLDRPEIPAQRAQIPLFPVKEQTMREPMRDDTLRMSAENAGLGLDAPPATQSSFTGEQLSASPPHDTISHDDGAAIELGDEADGSQRLSPRYTSQSANSPNARGGSLPKLEIPDVPVNEGRDRTMTAASGEETAGPQTARPGRPNAEVEKLLEQLTSQGQSLPGIPSFTLAPATPLNQNAIAHLHADFYGQLPRHASLADYYDGSARPVGRQRSHSDATVPQWAGIDPRMLGVYDPATDSSALSDGDDLENRESLVGPRRRSVASSSSSPYLGAQQFRDTSRDRHHELVGLRRSISSSQGHRRNAYSEDFGAHIKRDDAFMPFHVGQIYPDYAAVPNYDDTSSGPTTPLSIPDVSLHDSAMTMPGQDLSAIPHHLMKDLIHRSNTSSPSLSDQHSDFGGEIIEDPVHWESQTTVATKHAAAARRKPGTEAKFSCDYCGETFTRQYNLKGHLRAHNGEKPFACEEIGCHKAFARAHDLRRHMALHTNVAKYQCHGCHKAFKRLDALQRHHKSDAGQHCVAKLIASGAFVHRRRETEASFQRQGEIPPFPSVFPQTIVL